MGSNHTIAAPDMSTGRQQHSIVLLNRRRAPDKLSSSAVSRLTNAPLELSEVIECATVAHVEVMASVSQYHRGGGNRSIVVCGGAIDQNRDPTASCEELSIDANGLPLAVLWFILRVVYFPSSILNLRPVPECRFQSYIFSKS